MINVPKPNILTDLYGLVEVCEVGVCVFLRTEESSKQQRLREVFIYCDDPDLLPLQDPSKAHATTPSQPTRVPLIGRAGIRSIVLLKRYPGPLGLSSFPFQPHRRMTLCRKQQRILVDGRRGRGRQAGFDTNGLNSAESNGNAMASPRPNNGSRWLQQEERTWSCPGLRLVSRQQCMRSAGLLRPDHSAELGTRGARGGRGREPGWELRRASLEMEHSTKLSRFTMRNVHRHC